MNTILDLGLTGETIRGLIATSGDERFAYDSYRRLIQMYGKVVLGVAADHFEHAIAATKARVGVQNDIDLDAQALHALTELARARRRSGQRLAQ